ncbi:MAG: hypothetical protein AB2A00_27530 [Myxococcota bacterium]
MHVLLLAVGLVLTALGPLAPLVVGGGKQVVQLLDLGLDGVEPRVTLQEVTVLAPSPIRVTGLGPTLVELRAPVAYRAHVEEAVRKASRPASPALECTTNDEACLHQMLRTRPLYNRAAGPLDALVEVEQPASRGVWLLGMLVGLVGLALTVLSLARWRGLEGGTLWSAVLGTAVAGGLVGGSGGWMLASRVHQGMVVRPAYRPLLDTPPGAVDHINSAHNASGRIQSPAFLDGLRVTVRGTPDTLSVLLHAEAEGLDQLRALELRVREHVILPEQEAVADFLAAAERVVDVTSGVARDRLLQSAQQVSPPYLSMGELEPESRGPVRSGAAGALAGALLGWAALSRRSRR